MSGARGYEVLAEVWDEITRKVRNYDVIDGEVLSVTYHDEMREIS